MRRQIFMVSLKRSKRCLPSHKVKELLPFFFSDTYFHYSAKILIGKSLLYSQTTNRRMMEVVIYKPVNVILSTTFPDNFKFYLGGLLLIISVKEFARLPCLRYFI